jgi:hypothetical protein
MPRKSSLKDLAIQSTLPAKELKFEITPSPTKEAPSKEDLDEVALKI